MTTISTPAIVDLTKDIWGQTLNADLTQLATDLTTAQGQITTLQASFNGNAVLIGWTNAQAWTIVSATYNANNAITTASVLWPDGASGTYTADTLSSTFLGATDAFHVTYSGALGTHTVTQTAVTRNASGYITAQPAPVVS